jgi:hypothetical protein
MPKHSSHILALARKGAEHKYQELKAELAELVKDFPHLAARTGQAVSRGAAALSRRGKAMVAAAGGGRLLRRKRRKMSAKARQAISAAQKKRWAAQKAAAVTAEPARKAGQKR